MKFVVLIIWVASTIDISSTLQIANFRFSGLLWISVSFFILFRTLLIYPLDKFPVAPLRRNFWFLTALAYYGARTIDSEKMLYAIVDLQSLFLPAMVELLVYDTIQNNHDIDKIERTVLKSIVVPVTLLGVGLVTGLSTFVEGVGQKGYIGARSISLYSLTVLSIALAILVYDHKNREKKNLALFASSVCFVSILVTLSRTALLSSFTMLLIIGFFTMNVRNLIKSLTIIAVVVAISLQWGPMAERIIPKDAASFEDVAQSGEFTSGRALLWTYIFKEGINSPIFGSGTGNVKNLIETNMRSSGILPHNEYIRFFYDGGAVGLLIICMAIFSRLKSHLMYLRGALLNSDVIFAKWNFAALLSTIAMTTSAIFDNVFLYQFMLCIVFTIYGVTDKLYDLNLRTITNECNIHS